MTTGLPLPASPPQSSGHTVALLARDIKLSHTVFALPFALLGLFLATADANRWPRAGEVLLILGCMVAARTFAMLVNRLVDARFDRNNPRTAGRAVASGRVSPAAAAGSAGLCAATFVALTGGFWMLYANPLPTVLSLPVLAVLGFYSFAKRWTWACHLLLGLALAISPVAAAVAVEPGYVTASPTVWWIAAAVLAWVAGFDIIYALQDVDFDRDAGLYSMPASLGVERALWLSRLLHVIAISAFTLAGLSSPLLHPGFLLAVLTAGLLLLLEHLLIVRSAERHLHHAFFTVNGLVSLLLGTAGIVGIVLGPYVGN